MGLLIIFAVLLIVGIVLGVRSQGDSTWAMIISVLGGLSLIVALLALACIQLDYNRMVREYEQDVVQIGLTYNTDTLTGEERAQAIALAVKDNAIILSNKDGRKNLLVGIFFSEKVAELPLFDLTKISQARSVISIDKE
jgi:hypothetical protein